MSSDTRFVFRGTVRHRDSAHQPLSGVRDRTFRRPGGAFKECSTLFVPVTAVL